jgi:hypothetical protein
MAVPQKAKMEEQSRQLVENKIARRRGVSRLFGRG